MKNWVYLVLLGLGVIILSLWAANKKLTSENERLTANATALMDRADYYETEAGKSAASVQKLTLDYSELQAGRLHLLSGMCPTREER